MPTAFNITAGQIASLIGFTGSAWVTDSADSNSQDLASSLSMSGAGQDYEITGEIITPADTVDYSLEPNSLATDQDTRTVFGDGATTGADSASIIKISETSGTGSVGFWARIVQMSGQHRFVFGFTWSTETGTFGSFFSARWNVTTTITSLRLHASTTTGIQIGSTIRARAV